VIAPSEILRFAAKRALKIRTVGGYSLERPCDVYELIFHSRLELQFFAVPTLEGMYLEDGHTRRICVSAFRPPGRQRFTAAHELAHSALLHGTRVDTIKELKEKTIENDVDEESADTVDSDPQGGADLPHAFVAQPSQAVYEHGDGNALHRVEVDPCMSRDRIVARFEDNLAGKSANRGGAGGDHGSA